MAAKVRHLDRGSPVPLHHQLKLSIVESIESGAYRQGAVLPTEREFEQAYGVSRVTVRQALAAVEHDGYISRQPGKGTTVVRTQINRGLTALTSFSEEMRSRGQQTTSRLLEFGERPARSAIAQKLAVPPRTRLVYVLRLRMVEDGPIAVSASYLHLPARVTLSADELTQAGSLWSALEGKGLPILESDKTFEAIAADAELARLLDVAVGSPLLSVEGVAYTHQHLALEYHRIVTRADRYRYSLYLTR